ncbi:nucleoside kinase [Qiania dongpingensis]|uniref:Nucleoside kinase n=1 Tax=Qiania dongpingensis TaxID=2763669 RepID=A0A7G9G400_9FIRM|nr:nucleoside kinase [Qiania dongpingensis]QNM05532.1 nucleoside kinase [Qiania dongpingensis]
MWTVICGGKEMKVEEGATLLELSERVRQDYSHDILLASVDGKLSELHKKVKDGSRIEFFTAADKPGFQTYRRSMIFLLVKAIYAAAGRDVLDKVLVDFAISKGVYVDIRGDIQVDEAFVESVSQKMKELVEEKLPLMKRSVSTDEAVDLFGKYKMYDKEKLFHYRRVSKVNIYSIREFEDYYYGYMVCNTGYLKYFKLYYYDGGIVIQMPTQKNPEEVPEFVPGEKVYQCQKESSKWGEALGVDTVGDLNDRIVSGGINELILVQEALMEKRLGEIATEIARDRNRKFVMIAGPSSSGKTTFSHRLSIQLRTLGLEPHPIAVDNYFVNREDTPRDEFGEYNYECLEAIDVKQFNQDMCALLEGKTVAMPTFNFKKGRREYKGDTLTMGPDDILVVEGIHGLNDKLSYSLPPANKFKIYISALTQLNIDEHNRIPSTDGRLIRRMVRDARTRGTAAKDTIAMWPSVRRGEEENIFPYQESADVVFNSALIYELAVLKPYAEPLLFGIPKDAPEYMEAKRLLKFFDYFLTVVSEDIPKNSLLREFIGGSCFHV